MREARERRGITQGHIARTLSAAHGLAWHQTTTGKVETGERRILLAEALAVADVLGVPLAELLGADQEPTSRQEGLVLALAELRELREHLDGQVERLAGEVDGG